MEETKIIYKRTPAWWIATCYLLGTIALLLYAVISLLGLFTNVGVEGFKALKESSDQQQLETTLANTIKSHIKVIGYKAEPQASGDLLTLSIKNDSDYAIQSVHVEIAALDMHGLPSQTWDEWLNNLNIVYPGDTAHAQVKLRDALKAANRSYDVRISRFRVVGEEAIRELCEQNMTAAGNSI